MIHIPVIRTQVIRTQVTRIPVTHLLLLMAQVMRQTAMIVLGKTLELAVMAKDPVVTMALVEIPARRLQIKEAHRTRKIRGMTQETTTMVSTKTTDTVTPSQFLDNFAKSS